MKNTGISDKGFKRLAQAMGGDDSFSAVKELQEGISGMDVGLYYDASVAVQTLADNFDDPENWVVIETPGKYGGDLLQKINFEAIAGTMTPYESKNLPNSELAFKVSDGNGELNEAGVQMQDLVAALANYPVLDDEAYSNAQMDQALDSIESNGWSLLDEAKAPEDWASEVFDAIRNSPADHTLYEDSGDGIYVHEDDIKEALAELGWLLEDE